MTPRQNQTAILVLVIDFLTIFLTVRGDNMHLHTLPVEFVTIPYVLCLFIIGHIVLSDMFKHECMFLYPLPQWRSQRAIGL